MPYDFDHIHIAALVLIFAMWTLYGPILNWLGHGTLNAQLHVHVPRVTSREPRL
jgi:hypothetical protein